MECLVVVCDAICWRALLSNPTTLLASQSNSAKLQFLLPSEASRIVFACFVASTNRWGYCVGCLRWMKFKLPKLAFQGRPQHSQTVFSRPRKWQQPLFISMTNHCLARRWLTNVCSSTRWCQLIFAFFGRRVFVDVVSIAVLVEWNCFESQKPWK